MMVELSKRKAVDQTDETVSKNAKFSDNPILSGKIAKVNQWRILRVFKVFSEHPDNLTKNFFLNLLLFFFFKL